MTTKPSHKIEPMSHEHVRWAIHDMLKDPEGPLKGMKMPEALSGGKPEAQAVLELLSSCGIRRGAKEFFARVLENEDADIVDKHIGGYGERGQNLAAKSLIKIILVNAREERPDTEVEAALFQCIWAAEKMREKDGELALAFLEFCGSAAFGSESLKRLARCCYLEDTSETALWLRKAASEKPDSVIYEFFLAVRQVACSLEEDEVEGMLRYFFRSCCDISRECPEALYSFLYYFSNSSWESMADGLFYMGLFDDYGVLQAFAVMGRNHTRIAELADEFFQISKAAAKDAEAGEEGVREAIKAFSHALGRLSEFWPAVMVPFSRYFRRLLEDKRLDRVQALVENFTSEENAAALEGLKDDPRMQLAFMEACYMAAVGIVAN
jgi:hypothetical protein